ncbi:hypothetical protein [Oceanospirillum beijerinckii]|uniref:hypothetical protein n=1 Tax=Oceanospirillum beijerinckii TaxID=64976 RepID=UPI0003F5A172|nr:hypothetical protein [Oceanospirillum beijerinckii]
MKNFRYLFFTGMFCSSLSFSATDYIFSIPNNPTKEFKTDIIYPSIDIIISSLKKGDSVTIRNASNNDEICSIEIESESKENAKNAVIQECGDIPEINKNGSNNKINIAGELNEYFDLFDHNENTKWFIFGSGLIRNEYTDFNDGFPSDAHVKGDLCIGSTPFCRLEKDKIPINAYWVYPKDDLSSLSEEHKNSINRFYTLMLSESGINIRAITDDSKIIKKHKKLKPIKVSRSKWADSESIRHISMQPPKKFESLKSFKWVHLINDTAGLQTTDLKTKEYYELEFDKPYNIREIYIREVDGDYNLDKERRYRVQLIKHRGSSLLLGDYIPSSNNRPREEKIKVSSTDLFEKIIITPINQSTGRFDNFEGAWQITNLKFLGK